MFYGQNCSGRLGEKKNVICVVGCENDFNFFKLVNKLNIKDKRGLNKKDFLVAQEFTDKFKIKISPILITTKHFLNCKDLLKDKARWFEKLYGIFCYKALEPIIKENVQLHMDREYDTRTLAIAAWVIRKLASDNGVKVSEKDIYLRKEKEFPSYRIRVADIFARGIFREFEHSFVVRKNIGVDDEIKRIFKK